MTHVYCDGKDCENNSNGMCCSTIPITLELFNETLQLLYVCINYKTAKEVNDE